jgi:glycosyltransferase involved in cell wall biosynthesis
MKIAFVLPWYGKILGGAENACRAIAENLSKEIEVHVITTCIKDFYSNWSKNYWREGDYELNGVKIHRFAVIRRETKKFDEINYKLMCNQRVSHQEEEVFIREMIKSPKLYEYIKTNSENFDFFLFTPYMFSTTYYGALIHPHKSILIPCLHDESYAYMSIYQKPFQSVRGLIFYSQAEKKLAKKIFSLAGKSMKVIGVGVDTNIKSNGDRFRKKYRIKEPFILYVGRKEVGKNLPLLFELFSEYKKRNSNSLKLVLVGPGCIRIPKELRKDIIDLGFIPTQDKNDAYSAAMVLCQPSVNESFSIAVMESWLAGRPVLVNEGCGPTRDFCEKSNGGLWFSTYDDFESCVNLLLNDKKIADTLGMNGRKYVLETFSWNRIKNEFLLYLNSLR